jgi:thiol-disulfide isomerase/thioredoxin
LKNFINKSACLPCLLLFFCLWSGNFPAYAETKPIAKGALFPNVAFSDLLTKDSRLYIGIPPKKKFSLKDMKGTLFVFEVFSTYCLSCPKNIPVFNAVYANARSDAAFRGKVKVIGIAVGNTAGEMQQYNKEFKVLYPVLTDYSFAVHKALGNVRVPFTIFVKKDVRGRCVVVATHQGVYDTAEEVIKTLQALLR